MAGTRSGTATVGGNPEAGEQAHGLMFECLSRQLNELLRLSHEERYLVPPSPKAFVVTEKGGWYWGAGKDVRCWLHAVDDRVVWHGAVFPPMDGPRSTGNRPSARRWALHGSPSGRTAQGERTPYIREKTALGHPDASLFEGQLNSSGRAAGGTTGSQALSSRQP